MEPIPLSRCLPLSCLWILALPPRGLAAQGAESEVDDGEIEAAVEADLPLEGEEYLVEERRAEVILLPGATVTVLDLAADSARVLDLGDMLQAAPGIQVRRTGGVGSPQLVQLRGASGGQVRLLVDGIPLPQDASGAVDLSSLPLESAERVEVYRGSLPLGMGGEGLAGAINLVTRKPEGLGELRLSAGAGSFHTYEGSAGVDLGAGVWRASLWTAGQFARNDFVYYDDNGTPYTSADDRDDARRSNADARRGELALNASRESGGGRLSLAASGVAREAGIPGPASYQVSDARLAQRRAQASTRFEGGAGLHGATGLSAQWDWQHYQDPQGEVGLGLQDEQTGTGAAAVDGLLDWTWLPEQQLAASARLELQQLSSEDATSASAQIAVRRRDRLSSTLEARGKVWTLGYGARLSLDAARSSSEGSLPLALGVVGDAEPLLLLSPAASLAWQPTALLGLRASGGLGHRLPSFPELYGDAGTVVGNEDLLPERGWSVDLGADLAGDLGPGPGTLSITGYHRDLQQLIAYVQNSQYTLRAENFERAWISGAEAEGRLDLDLGRLGLLDLGLAYAFTWSLNLSPGTVAYGNALPGLPVQDLFADLQLGPLWLRPAVSVELQGRSYRDSANLLELPPRAFLHLRLVSRPLPGGPQLCLELRNALDHRVEATELVDLETGGPAMQAVSDYLGYPLPGRALYLSAEWALRPWVR